MNQIHLVPGLVTIGLFTVAALAIAWLSHRGNDHKKRK